MVNIIDETNLLKITNAIFLDIVKTTDAFTDEYILALTSGELA